MNFKITPIEKVKPTIFILVDEYSDIASRIAYEYKHDPEHKNKPSGDWKRTEKGWSERTDNKITVSPDVNAYRDEKLTEEENIKQNKLFTEQNTQNLSQNVESAILKVVKKNRKFTISETNKGRYLSDNGELFEEKSHGVDIKGISQKEAEDIARVLADQMKQESVLVWNEDLKKAKIIYTTSKKENDFELGPKSSKFLIDSDTDEDSVKKIDNAVKNAMKGKITGWSIVDSKEVVMKIKGKSYINKSNPIVFHGLEEDDENRIGKELALTFKSKVVMIDLKSGNRKVF